MSQDVHMAFNYIRYVQVEYGSLCEIFLTCSKSRILIFIKSLFLIIACTFQCVRYPSKRLAEKHICCYK